MKGMIIIVSKIPIILRELRLRRELTQEQVAKKLGIDRSTYAYYESGRIHPDVKMILRLSKVYNVEYTEILDSDAASICADVSKDFSMQQRRKKVDDDELDMGSLSEMEKSLLIGVRVLSEESRMDLLRIVSQKIQMEKKRKKHIPKSFQ